ncbi:MBL fold metallo-hydrolase [Vitreimonas sp.]|uniref:MBL fold metallo-hydrolase n=1 Tax=Vitreimonas sp. TaxID=3069702 RepID=UPI002EDA5BCF
MLLSMFAELLFALAAGAETAAAPEIAPQEIVAGVTLLPGSFEPERGPDGNTIVFDAPDGLVVIDTGRHGWQSDAILDLARTRGRPIAAIVNTHWHLDHSSGNGRVQAAFPNAPVYATNAIDAVLAPGGFLSRNLEGARGMLAGDQLSPVQREEVQIFIDTMAAADDLRPDVVIARDQRLRIAGRRFDVHVTDGAVSAADIWLYDRRTRVVVLGDLVTFPAPFFETACPEAWRAALDEVWATPFRIAIPGHGAPMDRAQFDTYRQAFGAFLDCVASDADASVCASAWSTNIADFIAGDERAQIMAPQMAAYYVDFLRANGGRSPDCAAPSAT